MQSCQSPLLAVMLRQPTIIAQGLKSALRLSGSSLRPTDNQFDKQSVWCTRGPWEPNTCGCAGRPGHQPSLLQYRFNWHFLKTSRLNLNGTWKGPYWVGEFCHCHSPA